MSRVGNPCWRLARRGQQPVVVGEGWWEDEKTQSGSYVEGGKVPCRDYVARGMHGHLRG